MRMKNLKTLASGVVLAAGLGTFSVFAHEGGGEGKGMMSGHMDGMMQMMTVMSDMSPEERQTMMRACMNMMQGHTLHERRQATEETEATNQE